ncbi:MAG: hypothetical protein AB8G05_20895 [Oligoflexales bacterium]
MNIISIKLGLFLLLLGLVQCATQNRRLGNLPSLSIDQVVHRNILKAVGVNLPKEPEPFIDVELAHYLKEFIEDAKSRGRNISSNNIGRLRVIKFVDDLSRPSGENVVASCNSYYLVPDWKHTAAFVCKA